MQKIASILLFLSLFLYSDEYIVIANSNLDIVHMTREDLKQIYLKQHKYSKDIKFVPVNLPPQNTIRKSFEKHILQMSRSRLRRFWTIAHYKGTRPPLTMQTPKSAKKFVEKIDGAVSYVSAQKLSKNSRIKIIYRWSDR